MAKWLVKAEPAECGIDDFAKAPGKAIRWDGVRNYQARNFLREMQVGDEVFMYHSSCKVIGIAGIVTVVRTAYPDPTQFDPESPYFDPKSTRENPRWDAVDMNFLEKWPAVMTLESLKSTEGLENLALVKRGNRLSVMPVEQAEWERIVK
jgi:predicted RNA-binding protein with PUA-like domain